MVNVSTALEETILIPTYETGKPEKNPIFLEKRVYQGSSGVVYPHAVIEKIHDVKVNKRYTAVFLENEFLKIIILPQLGGAEYTGLRTKYGKEILNIITR